MHMDRTVLRLVCAVVTMAILALAVGPVAAEPITITPTKAGTLLWNLSNGTVWGFSGTLMTERNYPQPPMRYVSYALWGLSAIDKPIASANLQGTLYCPNPFGWWGGDECNDSAVETFAVRDIGTDLNTMMGLTTSGGFVMGATTLILNDITTGLLYGSATARDTEVGQPLSVPMTWRGVQDINTAAGTMMGMGLHPTSGPKESVGLQNIRLVLYPFNDPVSGGGGIDFYLDDADVTTAGTVDLTERGCKHHLSAYAGGLQDLDEKTSEVRHRFTFQAGGNPDPRPVWLTANLEGELSAGDASASVEAILQLYAADGMLIDEMTYFESVGTTVLGQWEASNVAETMFLEAELVPGNIYEVISRLTLVAELDGPQGSGMADFADTFVVELSGVPEPATLALLALGGVLALRRRLR